MGHAKSETLPPRLVACPDCGLVVACETDEIGEDAVRFDVITWQRVCKRPGKESPLWCFVARDGTSTLAELQLVSPRMERLASCPAAAAD